MISTVARSIGSPANEIVGSIMFLIIPAINIISRNVKIANINETAPLKPVPSSVSS